MSSKLRDSEWSEWDPTLGETQENVQKIVDQIADVDDGDDVTTTLMMLLGIGFCLFCIAHIYLTSNAQEPQTLGTYFPPEITPPMNTEQAFTAGFSLDNYNYFNQWPTTTPITCGFEYPSWVFRRRGRDVIDEFTSGPYSTFNGIVDSHNNNGHYNQQNLSHHRFASTPGMTGPGSYYGPSAAPSNPKRNFANPGYFLNNNCQQGVSTSNLMPSTGMNTYGSSSGQLPTKPTVDKPNFSSPEGYFRIDNCKQDSTDRVPSNNRSPGGRADYYYRNNDLRSATHNKPISNQGRGVSFGHTEQNNHPRGRISFGLLEEDYDGERRNENDPMPMMSSRGPYQPYPNIGTIGTYGTAGSIGTYGTSGSIGTYGTSGSIGTYGTYGTSGSIGTYGTAGTIDINKGEGLGLGRHISVNDLFRTGISHRKNCYGID